jgi:hypothetical protein
VTTIDGDDFLVIDVAQFRIPLDWDPSSNMFIAVAAPTGGLGAFPALVKGDTGDKPTLNNINFTALEADDITPDSADFVETSPGNYDLDLALHKGPQGDPGDTVVTPSDFGTPIAGKIPVVNAALTNFELKSQKVGDRFVPASIANAPSGNPTFTLASISVPAQDFDWRPDVSGQCLFTHTNSNVRVDLIARLNDQASGNIVARGFGTATLVTDVVGLSSGPPPAASATYDKVAAGASAIIYLRAERIAGTGTFTTSGDTTWFGVKVRPIP